MEEDLIYIRRKLHEHPELGFEEGWTSNFIAENLSSLGLDVETHIARTGIVALVRGKNPMLPAIGYRADMDALPVKEMTGLPFASQNGCMHACGHDIHMTVALGVARYFASHQPRRNIAFVFQPNEEGAPGELPSGAQAMCEAGVIERYNIVNMFALHVDPTLPTGRLGVCSGALWAASGRFAVSVVGQAGHAAYPARSHDALLAASQMINDIYLCKARQRPADDEVLSICKFKAGDAFNVIAENALFEGIVRAPSRTHLARLFDIIKSVSSSVDIQFQTHSDVATFYGALPVVNDKAIADFARKTWGEQAVEVKMTMASEDFSHFSSKIPSFFAMLGVNPGTDSLPPLHASTFFADENAINVGVQAMCELLEQM